jgi:fucose permease
MMSLFLAAMMLGRWLGSWLASRNTSEEIVPGSVGVCLGGFLLHWWIPLVSFSMMGQYFWLAWAWQNLYPQILALAVGSAEHQTNLASARASLASGLAILLLPLLLGGLCRSGWSVVCLWYCGDFTRIDRERGFLARSTSPIQPFAHGTSSKQNK